MNGFFFVLLALLTGITSFTFAKKILNTNASKKMSSISYAGLLFFFGGVCAAILYVTTSFTPNDLMHLTSFTSILFICLDVILWTVGSCLFWPSFSRIPASEAI